MPADLARIGILTLHYGFNEGAILQAFALTCLLSSRISAANVEIVDHRHQSKLAVYGPPNDQRKKSLQRAIDGWLPLSVEHTRSNNDSQVKAGLKRQYGLLVYGSDQIWALVYTRRLRSLLGNGIFPAQRSGFYPAFPNVYWPDAELGMPQVTFAASVGTLRWQDIPQKHAAAMRAGLHACCLISVRDERTLRFLEWLDPGLRRRAALVADPTFSEPFRSELQNSEAETRLMSRLSGLGVDFSRPRCGFICKPTPATSALAHELRQAGVQTIAITTENSACDVRLYEHDFHPLDWARLFGLVDFCVSERMHACIFCLLQQTPFVALDINEVEGDNETKIRSLLRAFGIERHCLSANRVSAAQLSLAASELQEQTWDWPGIERQIRQFSHIQNEFVSEIDRVTLQPGNRRQEPAAACKGAVIL